MVITTKGKNLYPIRAAARLSGLSIDTLRAWEKRYAAVRPIRRKGVRLYNDAEVERLSLLRQAVAQGHPIGQASRMSSKDLMTLVARPTASRMAASSEGPIDAIFSAIEDFDYAGADRELARLASLMSPRDLIHEVALPLMRITGERWHEQRLRIAQEHIMSQLLSNLLGGMMRIYAPANPPAVILTGTFSDDLHEFGILAAAILAAGAGLGVIHLGANLPAREVSYAAKRSGANVVLMSITGRDLELSKGQLASVRAGVPKPIEIWAGVNPPNSELQVEGVRLLKDFRDLEREIQRVGGRF